MRAYETFKDDPGRTHLLERLKEQREEYFLSIARRIAKGDPIDQRELDYKRGFYVGAVQALEEPDKADKSLERQARLAYRMATTLEAWTQEEAASPYG